MNSSGEYSAYNTSPTSLSNTITSSPQSSSFVNSESSMFSDTKNNIIMVLLILVIMAFLGINLLAISGNLLEELSKIFGPTVNIVASMLGYSTGHLINTTADITADTAKLGIDIAEGSAQSIGNLLKNASKGGMNTTERRNLELTLSSHKPNTNTPENTPEPSQTADSIHRSISAKKGGWCFIGEDAGTRGCVSIDEHDKCMSGQIYPSKELCMNTQS